MDSARGRDLRSVGYGCQAASARKQARMVFPEHYSIGIRDFHLKTNLLSQINVIWGVQMARQKYSDFPKSQIGLYPCPSRLIEGRFAIVTDVRRDAVDAEGASDEGA